MAAKTRYPAGHLCNVSKVLGWTPRAGAILQQRQAAS
jgi:hypothetical protein